MSFSNIERNLEYNLSEWLTSKTVRNLCFATHRSKAIPPGGDYVLFPITCTCLHWVCFGLMYVGVGHIFGRGVFLYVFF